MPLNGAVARTMMRGITHVMIEARFLYFSRCVFEVAVVYKAIVLSVEVWVMSGYLGEVRVRRTSEGLR